MSTNVIIEGDETLATRDRRFICPFCGAVFAADSSSYTLATLHEEDDLGTVAYVGSQEDPGIAAFAECPTCGRQAVSPAGSKGLLPGPVALTLLSLPAKQIYRPGEKFDAAGMVLGLRLSDGSVASVELTDCTFSPDADTALTAEDTAITVTHTATELEIAVPVGVRRQPLACPVLLRDTYVYSGAAQAVEVRGFDSGTMTRANYSKTNAGPYEAAYTPKTGYCWPNGSTSAYKLAWEIVKAVPVITLGEEEMELTAIATPGTSTVDAGVSDGAVSVESSDETVCTAAYADGTVTVTAVADGEATVIVTAAGTDNCEEAGAEIAVTVALA